MRNPNLTLGLIVLLLAVAATTWVQNTQSVDFQFMTFSVQLPSSVLYILQFVLGAVAAERAIFFLNRKKQVKSGKIQVEWQKQDEKLIKEITSDKEKQLEAKIATLEAALKQALKKKEPSK